MIFAFDTTLLAYAEGVDDPLRHGLAARALDLVAGHETIVPAQALGELFLVLVRKKQLSPSAARASILEWRRAHAVQETSFRVLAAAMDLIVAHRSQVWDAVILSASVEGGADYLLSEDMQHGFSWRGLTVLNPLNSSGQAELSAIVRIAT